MELRFEIPASNNHQWSLLEEKSCVFLLEDKCCFLIGLDRRTDRQTNLDIFCDITLSFRKGNKNRNIDCLNSSGHSLCTILQWKTSEPLKGPLRKFNLSKSYQSWVFIIGRCTEVSSFRIYMVFHKTTRFSQTYRRKLRLYYHVFREIFVVFVEIFQFWKNCVVTCTSIE